MKYTDKGVEGLKIAYIGGGSRGWAWGLMSDLASCDDISGDVYLYDIDYEAALHNEIIGNKFNDAEGAKSVWNYKAVKTAGEALTDAVRFDIDSFNSENPVSHITLLSLLAVKYGGSFKGYKKADMQKYTDCFRCWCL